MSTSYYNALRKSKSGGEQKEINTMSDSGLSSYEKSIDKCNTLIEKMNEFYSKLPSIAPFLNYEAYKDPVSMEVTRQRNVFTILKKRVNERNRDYFNEIERFNKDVELTINHIEDLLMLVYSMNTHRNNFTLLDLEIKEFRDKIQRYNSTLKIRLLMYINTIVLARVDELISKSNKGVLSIKNIPQIQLFMTEISDQFVQIKRYWTNTFENLLHEGNILIDRFYSLQKLFQDQKDEISKVFVPKGVFSIEFFTTLENDPRYQHMTKDLNVLFNAAIANPVFLDPYQSPFVPLVALLVNEAQFLPSLQQAIQDMSYFSNVLTTVKTLLQQFLEFKEQVQETETVDRELFSLYEYVLPLNNRLLVALNNFKARIFDMYVIVRKLHLRTYDDINVVDVTWGTFAAQMNNYRRFNINKQPYVEAKDDMIRLKVLLTKLKALENEVRNKVAENNKLQDMYIRNLMEEKLTILNNELTNCQNSLNDIIALNRIPNAIHVHEVSIQNIEVLLNNLKHGQEISNAKNISAYIEAKLKEIYYDLDLNGHGYISYIFTNIRTHNKHDEFTRVRVGCRTTALNYQNRLIVFTNNMGANLQNDRAALTLLKDEIIDFVTLLEEVCDAIFFYNNIHDNVETFKAVVTKIHDEFNIDIPNDLRDKQQEMEQQFNNIVDEASLFHFVELVKEYINQCLTFYEDEIDNIQQQIRLPAATPIQVKFFESLQTMTSPNNVKKVKEKLDVLEHIELEAEYKKIKNEPNSEITIQNYNI